MRAYEPGDEPAIATLFSRTFGRPLREPHWRWKLKTQASPVENVWLAVREGRPIFHYAGIPTRVWVQGRELAAMASVDTMTDPDFQRRGLLTEVGKRTYDAWREGGVAFVFGLPNERWGSRAQALGWRKLFPLAWLMQPLRPEAILADRLLWPSIAEADLLGSLWRRASGWRSPRDPGVATRELTRAGDELDRLWHGARGDLAVSPVRDAAWVGWRYLGPPEPYRVLLAERNGEPVGYAAFRLVGDRLGTLAEVFWKRPDTGAARTLLSDTLARLADAGATRVVTLAVPGSGYHGLLRCAGFLRRKARFSVEMVPLAADLPQDVLDRADSWCLFGGDFDVI